MSRVLASVRPFEVPEEYYEVSEGFTSESTDISEFANRLASISKPKDIPKVRLKSRKKRLDTPADSQLSASLDNFGLSSRHDTDTSNSSTEATSSLKRLEMLRTEKKSLKTKSSSGNTNSLRSHISRSESSDSLKRVTFKPIVDQSLTDLVTEPKPTTRSKKTSKSSKDSKSSKGIREVVNKIRKLASEPTASEVSELSDKSDKSERSEKSEKSEKSETSSLEELKKAHKRKKKRVAKKETTYTTPTSKDSIKLQTKDMKKIKPKYYENIESGTFIKHINSYGKLSLGGYIWVRGLDETTNVIRNYWIVGMSPQSQGGKNYKIFWNNIKAVYIKPNTERDKLIEVVSKQHKALNDIANFLSKRHGKDFQMSVISESESIEKNKSASESETSQSLGNSGSLRKTG